MFHYHEICNVHGDIQRIQLDRLDSIETSLQAFYLLVDLDNGQKLIDHLNDIRRKKYDIERKDTDKKSTGVKNKNNNYSDEDDILTDEDKELLGFMREQPAFIAETRTMKNVGRHILPTKSKKGLFEQEQEIKIVDKLEEIPQLGFEE